MRCKDLLLELEAADTRLSAAAEAHVDTCVHCSGLVADFKAIELAARNLAEADPPERLWVALHNQLQSEGLVRESAAEKEVVASARPSSLQWLRLRPALAAAYLAAILIVAGVISVRVAPPEPDDLWAGVVVSVPEAVQADGDDPQVSQRNPVVTASYKNSLEIIDNFIRMCEKTVREHPNNEVAREYLYDAYQQKAELLAMTMERGAWGD